jgi:hypothetical protein
VALKQVVALSIQFSSLPNQVWLSVPQKQREGAHDLDLIPQNALRLFASHPRSPFETADRYSSGSLPVMSKIALERMAL